MPRLGAPKIERNAEGLAASTLAGTGAFLAMATDAASTLRQAPPMTFKAITNNDSLFGSAGSGDSLVQNGISVAEPGFYRFQCDLHPETM